MNKNNGRPWADMAGRHDGEGPNPTSPAISPALAILLHSQETGLSAWEPLRQKSTVRDKR
jgi:hypothetical protein